MSTSTTKPKRITSLDQFRGYTVAGMFLVNFLGGFKECATVLKHHHTYCSYADTIMPHFLFAVGFAFRLTFGRRAQTAGLFPAYRRVVTRFLGLFLVAFVIYHYRQASYFLERGDTWENLKEIGFWGSISPPLRRNWFQTLMHIACTGLWITPVIRSSKSVRIGFMIFSGVLHMFLSHWFNFAWCSSPTIGNVIDGGPIGVLTWSIPALLGTLVCDAVADAEGRPNLFKMFAWSILIMGLGWGMTFGTRLYDLDESGMADLRARVAEKGKAIGKVQGEYKAQLEIRDGAKAEIAKINEQLAGTEETPAVTGEEKTNLQAKQTELEATAQEARETIYEIQADLSRFNDKYREEKLAKDAVFPNMERFEGRSFESLIPELPFIPPPYDGPVKGRRADGQKSRMMREWNYWMISQRQGTLSYTTFCGGLSIFVYALFYIVCDIWGFQLGVFRTFGTNALVGYMLHGLAGSAVQAFMPDDIPMVGMWTGWLIFMWLVWVFVRSLEKNNIYVKL